MNLSVVFDSSAVFTKDPASYLSKAVAQAIREASDHPSLVISWYLPKIVLLERLNRIRERILKVFEHIQEASRILSIDLNVTLEQLQQAAKRTADDELSALGVQILPSNWSGIDWDRLTEDAAFRRPPFSPGESEKGFRDAIVVESYLQILYSLPANDKKHRAVLVTSDALMIQAAKDRAHNDIRTYTPSSLEGLRSIIATLLSELEEELINRLLPKATNFFYSPASPTSLYYSEAIPSRIDADFSSALQSRPPGADFRTNSAPSITSSRFVKKVSQRFFWANQVIFTSMAYRYSPAGSGGGYTFSSSQPSSFTPQSSASGQIPLGPTAFSFPGASSIYVTPYPSASPQSSPFPVAVSNGSTIFEVVWSTEVSPQEDFTSAKLEQLSYIGTEWS